MEKIYGTIREASNLAAQNMKKSQKGKVNWTREGPRKIKKKNVQSQNDEEYGN